MKMQIQIHRELVPVLQDLARRERRTPREQAAWLLEKALEAIRDTGLAGTTAVRLWESPHPPEGAPGQPEPPSSPVP